MSANVNRPDTLYPELLKRDYVLLVDDELPILYVLSAILIRHGYHPVMSTTAENALARIEKYKPTLILLDFDMPRLNGLEVCRILKADESTAGIPIIFISGRKDISDKIQAFDTGAVDFIEKPFLAQEVLARVAAHVKLKHTTNELSQLLRSNNNLLLEILPSIFAERIQNGEQQPVIQCPDTSVLFCDIARFTTMAAKMSPSKVVSFLSQVYSELDELAEKYQLEKIKTIGDSYLAAAGVTVPMADHASTIADFALECSSSLKALERKLEIPISFRIGIDSGPLAAGIIGSKRPAFDIWGDTVNTASRMESTCPENQIQISSQTKKLLGGAYQFGRYHSINVKGKGKMNTYCLLAKGELQDMDEAKGADSKNDEAGGPSKNQPERMPETSGMVADNEKGCAQHASAVDPDTRPQKLRA